MNYFYFFFFLLLSILILIKPFTSIIGKWVLNSTSLIKTGSFTFLIGCLCIYFGVQNEFWYERVWAITTLTLGIVLAIRGLVVIFFLDSVKKLLSLYMNNYFKISIPVSIFLSFISFLIVLSD